MILHEHCRALGHDDPGEDYDDAGAYGTVDPQDGSAPVPVTASQAAELAHQGIAAHRHCGVDGHTDPGEETVPAGKAGSDLWEVPVVQAMISRDIAAQLAGEPKGVQDVVAGREAIDAVLDWAWQARGSLRGTALWNSYPGPATMKLATEPVTNSREHVVNVINEAANMTAGLMHGDYENSESIAADSAMDMVVNIAGYLLEHPGATVDDVILANWADERDEDETDAELIDRVKGWLIP